MGSFEDYFGVCRGITSRGDSRVLYLRGLGSKMSNTINHATINVIKYKYDLTINRINDWRKTGFQKKQNRTKYKSSDKRKANLFSTNVSDRTENKLLVDT